MPDETAAEITARLEARRQDQARRRNEERKAVDQAQIVSDMEMDLRAARDGLNPNR